LAPEAPADQELTSRAKKRDSPGRKAFWPAMEGVFPKAVT
jgi:hypothetical protein